MTESDISGSSRDDEPPFPHQVWREKRTPHSRWGCKTNRVIQLKKPLLPNTTTIRLICPDLSKKSHVDHKKASPPLRLYMTNPVFSGMCCL